MVDDREKKKYDKEVLQLLSSWNVCSKEWIVRQYDHEVQAGTVVKPLVGARSDGPGDAAVIRPVPSLRSGLAIGCGMNPWYGDIDAHAMACSAIDEAVRNVVCVGGDPDRTAILDNFSWGDCEHPESLGALVRACQGCADAALAFGTPFISGKDSLNNVYDSGGRRRSIPHSLLISAISVVPDVRSCVTMDLKMASDPVYVVGTTRPELGGSEFYRLLGEIGNSVPTVDLEVAPLIFRALAKAIRGGHVRACHDLSEGGLAVAASEMAIAGDFGLGLELAKFPTSAGGGRDFEILFSESNTRFLVEVRASDALGFEAAMKGVPCVQVGEVLSEKRLVVRGVEDLKVVDLQVEDLREAWQKPLGW